MLILKKLSEAMREIGYIGKNRSNSSQGYKFRGIDDIYLAVNPVFAKLGIVVYPEVLEVTRTEKVTPKGTTLFYVTCKMQYTFTCEDGSKIETSTIGEAMDSGDKASNKAMSAALKYAILQTFMIPTEEDNDTENHSHEVVAPTKKPNIPFNTVPVTEHPNVKGSYIIDWGKYKGVDLYDVEPDELKNYANYIKKKSKDDNKPITGKIQEFMRFVECL